MDPGYKLGYWFSHCVIWDCTLTATLHVYIYLCRSHLVVFEWLTEKHLPELYTLLKHKLQIMAMISLSWFLTLFLSVMDNRVAVNIIDCFFIDGAKVR